MNLPAAIGALGRRADLDRLVHWIGDHQQRFDQVFAFFTGPDPELSRRAAWAVSYAVLAHPRFMDPHFEALLRNLDRPRLHDAVKRNTVRLLQDIPIPEAFQGRVMTRCFDYLLSPTEKPAVKAFSLTVLRELARQYPDIRGEIVAIIRDRWDHESMAFRSRARKLLREWTSEMSQVD